MPFCAALKGSPGFQVATLYAVNRVLLAVLVQTMIPAQTPLTPQEAFD